MIPSARIPIFHVDAFVSNGPFTGNPAAVCLLTSERDPRWMQDIASEMNLSETAFVVPSGDSFNLRWFTPTVEVDLCGHATLATAHVLWESRTIPADRPAVFQSRSGRLVADRDGEWIELDFPAKRESPCEPPPGLLDALGVTAEYVGKNQFDYLVVVESEKTVRHLAPDAGRLRALNVRGVIVTARTIGGPYDFVSRFFAPGSGIDEDPVTGSAHCCLGPYWQRITGKDTFTAYQASRRGGVINVHIRGERVLLRGRAVTISSGSLL